MSVSPLLSTVNRRRRQQALSTVLGLAALTATLPGLAAPALAQGYGYQVIAKSRDGLEIRFHGLPLRAVHADDGQNALSIAFQQAVNGAMFDHLTGDALLWISMAYANFDNGIIRSPRPVTFFTRSETNGFSLRIVPRGALAPTIAQNEPMPPPLRGSTYGASPVAQQPSAPPPPLREAEPQADTGSTLVPIIAHCGILRRRKWRCAAPIPRGSWLSATPPCKPTVASACAMNGIGITAATG